ncbi:MAG TPA: molybdopterin-dependent oxidoreductase [Pyrinomonadaceae bacterium]|nr:molybdopterin-dependent oxidoreductase [Pyrinomonadaceae bacterium]
MKIINLAILLVFLFAFTAFAQTDAKTVVAKTEPILKIEVEGGKTLSLTAKDLAKFTRREVKAKAHDEKESTYSGFNLSDVLLDAGAKLGKGEMRGKDLAAYLVIEAADGYKVTFAIAEIAPEFTDKVVLLADTRDGKPLDEKEGVWQLIVPDEKKHGRWVRQVVKISLIKISAQKAVSQITNENDLIREIVFRKVLENRIASNKAVREYFLLVDGSDDPSENLLKKFADSKFLMRKASEKNEKGVLLWINKLTWQSNDEVKVTAGSGTGNLGMDSCNYGLKRENKEWKIISVENCVVS